ncbi:hypothetical protein MTY_2571 [Moorella thermoacetica Y72]|uniref:Uncharacterized protein n=1 Tax=Moorella thermoacetica Y72 TaxID=1325331 RepID=A0A0S6UI56_NEOTH|nr:hypothetical protein MTY_2571 [Moorella thermoacetica Y72]
MDKDLDAQIEEVGALYIYPGGICAGVFCRRLLGSPGDKRARFPFLRSL